MKTVTKAFLLGGLILAISSGISLLFNSRNSHPFLGTYSVSTLFLIYSLWLICVAGLGETANYISHRRKDKQRQSKINIWDDLSPKALWLIALAVFFIFATIGPLSAFMDSGFHDLNFPRIFYSAVLSGGLVASIFLLGKKPVLLTAAIVLFSYASVFEDSIVGPVDETSAITNDTRGQIIMNKDDYLRYGRQRENLGILTMILIVGGYSLFVFSIGSEAKKRVQFESEINIAKKIQQELLPKCISRHGNLSINGATIPAKEVGGDYYDCFTLSPDEHLVVLADASGHGVGSGILSAMMKTALAGFLPESSSLSVLFEKINRTLYKITAKSQFVTAGAIKINKATHVAEIITAGHHPILHKTKNGIVQLRTPSLALGLHSKAEYSAIQTNYSDGDIFIIFSDGITEARNTAGEMYSLHRLEDSINRIAQDPAADLSSMILDDARLFSPGLQPEDDMTVIGIRTGDHTEV